MLFPPPPQNKSVNPERQHGLAQELISIYAVKLGNWLLHVFALSLILGLPRTPTDPPFQPVSSSLCVHTTVVWGQGRRLPSPYFRYKRPPTKRYWTINDSPDQMSLFQRQSSPALHGDFSRVRGRPLVHSQGPLHGINTVPHFIIPIRFIQPPSEGSQPLSSHKHL